MMTSKEGMLALWEEHMRCEFEASDVEGTMATMVDGDAHLINPAVLTGGDNLDEIRHFYKDVFLPHIPDDTETTVISRTIGEDQIVDELIFKFTHDIEMPWILPNVLPTGKHVEVPMIVFVGVRDGKVAYEHIYWDQACVLVQIGLLDPAHLPVTGIESVEKLRQLTKK
jgi:carboxymethylenebutenolidase